MKLAKKTTVSPPSSLLATIPQRQKSHTDDIKSVWNLVWSSNWSHVHAVVKLYYSYFYIKKKKQTNAKDNGHNDCM